MRRAFTLIEVLVCIAIVLVIAAVLFPVVVKAKDAAYQTKSIGNMRQVQMAIELYAQENNGAASGTMEEMGLPPWPNEKYLGSAVKDLYPPKRTSVNWDSYGYNPIPSDEDRRSPDWAEYSRRAGSRAVLLWDPFFNPPPRGKYEFYWQDPYATKYVLGITVSGSIVKRTKAGRLDLAWWTD